MNIFKQNGLTILEAVIYTSLMCIIIIAGYKYYQINVRQYGIESKKAEIFQDLRTAVSMISKDISICGCDPLNKGRVGFVNENDNKSRYNTDADSIHITADIEYPWDGKASKKNETIIYFLYPQGGGLFKLGRCTGNGRRPQPVAENIVSLHFVYYNLSGQIMEDPPSLLESIGSVEFTISAQSTKDPSLMNKKDSFTLKARVWVRNNLF
jgi:hypothetical protein